MARPSRGPAWNVGFQQTSSRERKNAKSDEMQSFQVLRKCFRRRGGNSENLFDDFPKKISKKLNEILF